MSEQNGNQSVGTMSSLEERLNALESLVSKLESGQMSIDTAIESYSQGMKLAASCKKSLDEMTQKITIARKEAAKLIDENADEAEASGETASAPAVGKFVDTVPF